MDMEKYKVLLCVLESGSFTAAAEIMKYTPSGISRMMMALEEEQGFPLLVRGKGGVTPTKECSLLVPQIREVLYQGEKLRQLAEGIRDVETGSLVIGTAYPVFYHWIARMTEQFHREHKGIEIKIVNGYSSELVEQMQEHKVDFALVSKRQGEHQFLPVLQDFMVAMVPAEHEAAALEAIPVSLFATEPYINTYPGRDIDNVHVFQKCHIVPNTQFSTMDIYATYAMIEAGLGISMNNQINCKQNRKGIKVLPLNPPQEVTIGLAVTKDRTPAVSAFLEFIQPYLGELGRIKKSENVIEK